MTLQNGAGNDRKIEQYVVKKNIIIGTSKHNSVNNGNGHVRHSGTGATTIGSNLKENIICRLFQICLRKVDLQQKFLMISSVSYGVSFCKSVYKYFHSNHTFSDPFHDR